MALEQILNALEASMKGDLEKVNPELLESRDIRDTLTAFFAEQQARPDLVAQIRSQSLMYEYLKFPLKERARLERFRQEHNDYLLGSGADLNLKSNSKIFQKFVQKYRQTEQLLKIFLFYLENRDFGESFHLIYQYHHREKLISTLGFCGLVDREVGRRTPEGYEIVSQLAAEINPNIQRYKSKVEVLKIDGTNLLLEMLDLYTKHKDKNKWNYELYNEETKAKFHTLCKEVQGWMGNLYYFKYLVNDIRPGAFKYRKFWRYILTLSQSIANLE